MVRLAQWFSMRTPLIDGHGNFGNIDGDGAAAMRYTESRLAKPAMELLRDLQKDTVDWQPNYDESLAEPVVLPARFPNLLVNGSSGIAVGMATNIPPHNLAETVEATCAFIDNPDITVDELMQVMPGPDFPTAPSSWAPTGIRQAYETGRGSITIRAKAHVESTKTGRSRLVFTEIPYQVSKGTLQEKIAQLVNEKRIEGISDMRDESTSKGIPPRHRAQEGRGARGRPQQPLQVHLAADHLWREQPGARRRRAQVPVAARDPAPLR